MLIPFWPIRRFISSIHAVWPSDLGLDVAFETNGLANTQALAFIAGVAPEASIGQMPVWAQISLANRDIPTERVLLMGRQTQY